MNIHVSNLGTKITEESIRAIFATYGHVQSYRIMNEQPMGGQSNFAFIDMPDYQEATEAISRLNGSVVNGHQLVVKEYKTLID